MNVPQHVAIILDGNGRWAKKKGMPFFVTPYYLYCDHPGWEWALGEEERNAEKLRACPGKQKCRADL